VRIQGELLKLGFAVAQSTVAKYMAKKDGPPGQSWGTLRSYIEALRPPALEQAYGVIPVCYLSRLARSCGRLHHPRSAGLAPSTLRRRLAGIRKIHRLRLPNPVEDEEVLLAMRRALRTKPRQPKQAYGLTKDLRHKLIAACPNTLIGIRNRTIIAVGYDTLCRRSELVRLRVEDLSKLERGAMSILVRRAKNDPFGDGRFGFLTLKTVKLLKKWLNASDIREGWLFRRIYGNRIGSHYLHPYTITRIVKENERPGRPRSRAAVTLAGLRLLRQHRQCALLPTRDNITVPAGI
jgi:integrase